MYEPFQAPVSGIPVSSGIFCGHKVRTISSTSVGSFRFPQEFFAGLTYKPFQVPVWGIEVSSGIFRRHNVWTILGTSMRLSGIFRTHNIWDDQCGAFWLLQEIFAYRVYVTYEPDNTGARPNHVIAPMQYFQVKEQLMLRIYIVVEQGQHLLYIL